MTLSSCCDKTNKTHAITIYITGHRSEINKPKSEVHKPKSFALWWCLWVTILILLRKKIKLIDLFLHSDSRFTFLIGPKLS